MEATNHNIWVKAKQKARRVVSLNTFHEKLLNLKIKSFQPKVFFQHDFKNFRITTACCSEDLRKILKLRHQIFVKDLNRKDQVLEVDFDRYDLLADHIMIVDKTTNQVIGTYRILSTQFTNKFYSENEFKIHEIHDLPDHKIELGRACIHKDYRKGFTLHLIWQALAHYMKLVDARYAFGCSSVFTDDHDTLSEILNSFQKEEWGDDLNIQPTAKYRFPLPFNIQSGKDFRDMQDLIPPLLKTYLKAGAKIYGQPAWDRDFRCADIFTVLDVQKMTPKYHKKYFGEDHANS